VPAVPSQGRLSHVRLKPSDGHVVTRRHCLPIAVRWFRFDRWVLSAYTPDVALAPTDLAVNQANVVNLGSLFLTTVLIFFDLAPNHLLIHHQKRREYDVSTLASSHLDSHKGVL
jgi:hypothetical protein